MLSSYSFTTICIILSFFNFELNLEKIEEWLKKYVTAAVSKLMEYRVEERLRLGVAGFRIAESFNICMKVDRLGELFSSNRNVFPSLLTLFKKFPRNNIFQNEVLKLVSAILSSPLE